MRTTGRPGRPRGLMALIGAVTIVPLALLVWLGWRVLDQERILERQQARDRLERAGDLVAGALERAIVSSEQRLAAGADDWAEGAVAVIIQDERIEVYPSKRLPFLPKVTALPEAPAETFAEGEAHEFRTGNRAAAIEVYRPLTKSSDPAIRAGALLRLARNLAATGKIADALAVYEGMAALDGVAIDGAPASLVARYARCQLLESANRPSELRAEAQRFAGELASGRWSLTAPLYWLYAADVSRWAAAPSEKRAAELLAEAATRVWRDRASLSSRGRQVMSVDNRAMVVSWQKSDRALLALIADYAFAESQWINPTRAVATEQRVSFALASSADRADSDAFSTVRTAKQTELPWDLVVTSNGPGEQSGQFAVRRRLLVAGLTLMVAMALAAGFLIIFAVKRELAVAQLQADFVAAVSHEFRTPLTTLRQFIDMLREHEREAPGAGKERRMLCYDAQSRATERLTKLVESVLDFGRMQAGAQSYQLASCDCTLLVGHVVEEFRETASSFGCDVRFSGNGSAPIHADSDALGRAIWNLLENAVKYSPDRRQIDVDVHREGDAMRIAVHDHGIGIPPHEQGQIFAKFKRGEQARTRGIKGTGIGLAIVDEIVKAHRGHIEVKSAVNAGSTFTIVLPVVREAE